ncbi:MAG: hypothetical protein CMH57_03405 [Myxococcales bacterium]|nr:hypothetical protein [Myxococcales bacterium]
MPLLWLAFCLSGVAGLSYELTWVRYLTHLFGASTPAVSATVSIFFAGLGLGAWLGGRFFDKRDEPLLAYAGLEVAIGLVAATVPLLFPFINGLLSQRPVAGGLLEPLVLSTLLLIVPTTLIGATFPGMAAVVRSLGNPTRATGLFYGFNTLGAVLGCLLVSFWWLPWLGLDATGWLLVGINITIGLLVAASSRVLARAATEGGRASPDAPGASEARGDVAEPSTTSEGLSTPLAASLAAVSGFLGIAIEVMWFRGLALSFPGTVYVFALVLSAYLVGIGVGSLVIGRVFRDRAPSAVVLGFLYAGVALGCLITQNVIPGIIPWSVQALTAGWLSSWGGYAGWIALMAVGAMLPATLAMGAALPLLIGLATRGGDEAGQSAGRIYAANTISGVVGSLAGTFVLMPLLGVSRSLMLLALGYLAMALVLIGRAGLKPIYPVSLGAVLVLCLGLVAADLQPDINALRHRPEQRLLFYKDSPSATVSIYEEADGTRLLMANNQYALSGTHKSTVAMQYRLGNLPMLLHPKPTRSLLIGFATGTTLAAMASEPRLERLDCVEIHDLLFELGGFFKEVNHAVYEQPKVSLIEGDGRRYLARPGASYDVIVADLYVPRNPGVGSLYSEEHFRAVSARLAPGGLFITWLPLWQLSADETASIVKTFLAVYPEAEGWVGNWSPARPILGLMTRGASDTPPPARLEPELNRRTVELLQGAFPGHEGSWPGVRHHPDVSRQILNTAQLRAFAEGAILNNLDLPYIEFSSPRSMMQARFRGRPLSRDNLEAIDRVRPLRQTPWRLPEASASQRR